MQGLGKRVTVDQFRLQKRGGVGLKSINLTEGDSLAAIQTVRCSPACSLMLTGSHGLQHLERLFVPLGIS